MGGLFLFGGLASMLVLFFPVILILALLVILALRHDDDTDGNRAPAIYGSIIAFVALLTLLFAATGLVSSLVSLTADDSSGAISMSSGDGYAGEFEEGEFEEFEEFAEEDNNDAAISSSVGFLIAGVAALGLLFAHRALFDRRRSATGAARRVHHAYLLVLCLVTALIAMVAGGMAIFAVYRAIFPDTAGAENRADELRTLVTLVVLFVGAAGLWRMHWAELDLDRPDGAVTATVAP